MEIEAIMAHVQTFYNLEASLGTKIKLNTKAVSALPEGVSYLASGDGIA